MFVLVLYIHWSMKQLIKLGLLPHRQTCLLQNAQLAGKHTSGCRGLNVSLPGHRGWWLMQQCPMCYIEHQHIPTLFTGLMHINHLTCSTCGQHIKMESDNMMSLSIWRRREGWEGMREEEKEPFVQYSTNWNAVCLYPSASQWEEECWLGLLAAQLTTALCFLPPVSCSVLQD